MTVNARDLQTYHDLLGTFEPRPIRSERVALDHRPVFPSAPAVSDFLAGRRPLNYERVDKLAAFFHVSPALFCPARGRNTPIPHPTEPN
jgi:hypothetical protein